MSTRKYIMQGNDFYNGNPLLPKAGLRRELTPEQIEEYRKCAEDPIYFANNYFYAVHQEHGLMKIKLYDYQVEALEKFEETKRLIMLTARQVGKALSLTTKIPLFGGGFTTIGEVKIGDYIIGADGKKTKVTFKSEIHYKPTYRITFDDKTSFEACEDHIWNVFKRRKGKHQQLNLTTKEIAKTYIKNNIAKTKGRLQEFRYYVKNVKPVEYEKKNLKIDPYILGLWLGDGTSRSSGLTSTLEDLEHYRTMGLKTTDYICTKTNSKAVTVNIIDHYSLLRHYNLLQNKHIPEDFLYSSIEDRIKLLQGLMDTDGFVSKSGILEIGFSRNRYPQLLKDVQQLVSSLGIKSTLGSRFNKKYKSWSDSIKFTVSLEQFQPCTLPRKLERVKKSLKREDYVLSRTIQKVELIDTIPTQCIQVDNKDHLFVIGDSYTPTHNTTVATVIILHAALFNKNKNIALLANLQATAIEILDRIKEAFENLPDFLKQGIKTWNKKTVKFENGCTIFANASKGSSIRGKAIYMLYIDECAFVENWQDFAASTLPTITSHKEARIIYTSTPNGLNHFYDYCRLAKSKKNGYSYIEVPWYKVEGRDEAWKQNTLRDMNYDVERFAVEQECEFMGSSGTLIAGSRLKMFEPIEPTYIHQDLKVYKPKVGNHIYALIADSSEGKGLDYSAFSVIDITSAPYEQVATFRSNKITPQDYAEIIHTTCKMYNEPFVLIELNCPAGAIVAEYMFWDKEYENLLMTESAGRAGKKISAGFGKSNIDRGIYTSTAVKATGCTMLKLLIEQNQLIINDNETMSELKTFSRKNKSYEAEEGKHDDLVMGLVLFAWLTIQDYFKQITDVDINQNLKELTNQEIDDYVNGLGIMAVNDGLGEEAYA